MWPLAVLGGLLALECPAAFPQPATAYDFSKLQREKLGRGGIEPRTKDVPDGEYRWYDVLTWVPASDEYFWMGPGRFTPDGKSAVKGVYLDKIKFTLAE